MSRGSDELMKEHMNALTFTTDYRSAYKDADVIFIGVGTPEKKDGSANLSYVYTVAGQIAESIEKDCIVVVKSTVPIGTNDKIESFLRSKVRRDVNVFVASESEFLAQGTAVRDTLHASRIVIGVENPEAGEVLKKFMKTLTLQNGGQSPQRRDDQICFQRFFSFENFIYNEIANLCEAVGANIEDVSAGMGMDPRIGNRFLNAGIGYGGSCFLRYQGIELAGCLY